jgi:hypothetical protein
MTPSLPPSSSRTGVRVCAHWAATFLPVATLPVKASLSRPASMSAPPVAPYPFRFCRTVGRSGTARCQVWIGQGDGSAVDRVLTPHRKPTVDQLIHSGTYRLGSEAGPTSHLRGGESSVRTKCWRGVCRAVVRSRERSTLFMGCPVTAAESCPWVLCSMHLGPVLAGVTTWQSWVTRGRTPSSGAPAQRTRSRWHGVCAR